jgi:hypothetical protein
MTDSILFIITDFFTEFKALFVPIVYVQLFLLFIFIK